MKRLFEKLSMCLIMLIVAVTVSSCDYMKKTKSEIRHDDSLMVSKMMQETDNPTFANYSDALVYQKAEGQWRHQDSVFFSIPEKVMCDVVSVLEKSGEPINKRSISHEFEMNKHVYLNLPDNGINAVLLLLLIFQTRKSLTPLSTVSMCSQCSPPVQT